jgi:hypothetical protein
VTRWDKDGTGWDEVQGLRLDCGIALLTTGAQQSRANCNEVGPWFLGSTEDWGLTSSVVGVSMEVPFGPWPLQKGTFRTGDRTVRRAGGVLCCGAPVPVWLVRFSARPCPCFDGRVWLGMLFGCVCGEEEA